MKKYFYYACFTILTLILSLIIHALLEMLALHLIINNLELYGESWLWQNWVEAHAVFSSVLWLLGLGLGLWGGRHFWRRIYIEKRFGEPRW
jgi:hypothetical protein